MPEMDGFTLLRKLQEELVTQFVAISMGEPSKKMFEYLQKVRQTIEDLHIPHSPTVSEWVTVSIGGVAMIPETGSAYDI